MIAFSASFTVVQVIQAWSSKVACRDFPSLRKEDFSAFGTALWPDAVGLFHWHFHDKAGIRFLPVALEVLVVERCDELHDLEGARAYLEKALEEEIVKYQPWEIGALDKILELALLCIKVLERTTAEGTAPPHELVQVDLFPASRAGGMGCMHS